MNGCFIAQLKYISQQIELRILDADCDGNDADLSAVLGVAKMYIRQAVTVTMPASHNAVFGVAGNALQTECDGYKCKN